MKFRDIPVTSMADADTVERTLAQDREASEQDAVMRWLAEGHRPTVVERGRSALFDEFGLPMEKASHSITERTARRVRIARKLQGFGVTPKGIAQALGMPITSYRSMMNRWGTGS
jgi:hypothetical protein